MAEEIRVICDVCEKEIKWGEKYSLLTVHPPDAGGLAMPKLDICESCTKKIKLNNTNIIEKLQKKITRRPQENTCLENCHLCNAERKRGDRGWLVYAGSLSPISICEQCAEDLKGLLESRTEMLKMLMS